MINQDILRVALKQSAIDSGCAPEDFLLSENKVVLSKPDERARKYLSLPHLLDLTSYGSNIVASASKEYQAIARAYIEKYSVEHCFETPNLHVLTELLRPLDANVCFMAEYFLPDLTALKSLPCPYETRVLTPPDFADCYRPQWSNALCEKRKHLDVLAVGAFDGGQMLGMAGCSADGEHMWQIGVDVLPAYRRRGVASALTSALAIEILAREKVPFYCCAWANIKSARNAVRAGFRPAWAQLTVKPNALIETMNR